MLVCNPYQRNLTLHKKWSFPFRISSVNVTKSAGNCRSGHIYWRNSCGKLYFSSSADLWSSMYPKTCRNGYEFKTTILCINSQVQITLILEYRQAVELQRVNDFMKRLHEWCTRWLSNKNYLSFLRVHAFVFNFAGPPCCIFQKLWVIILS